jgi:hypothetical protein
VQVIGNKSNTKKQNGQNDDLMTMWASTFRMRRDSANNSEARKTLQTFNKPQTMLDIDPEYQQAMITKA